jgi:hypothetical protein
VQVLGDGGRRMICAYGCEFHPGYNICRQPDMDDCALNCERACINHGQFTAGCQCAGIVRGGEKWDEFYFPDFTRDVARKE